MILTLGYRAWFVFCGGHFEFLLCAWSADAILEPKIKKSGTRKFSEEPIAHRGFLRAPRRLRAISVFRFQTSN